MHRLSFSVLRMDLILNYVLIRKCQKTAKSQKTTRFWINWLLKQNKLRLVDYIFRIFLKSPRYARATGDFFVSVGEPPGGVDYLLPFIFRPFGNLVNKETNYNGIYESSN